METVLRMLKEIEERIQVIAFSEKEKYDNYIKRIQAIKQDLSSLDDRDNTIGEKNRVMEAIGMLDLETKMYIEYGTNFDKNEDITLTLEAKGQASGKEKAKQARIELYKSICEDLKKLEEINLEDIKKIKKQWDIEKESSLEYSIFEIEQIEEALSEVLLNYYIKYFNQHKTVPEKLDINEYCNIEVFIKKIKEVLIIHISQHNGLKKLEYINLLNDFSKVETRQLKPEYRNDFTFLTEEQCYGDEILDIFKIRGNGATPTDFAYVLGSYNTYWTKTIMSLLSSDTYMDCYAVGNIKNDGFYHYHSKNNNKKINSASVTKYCIGIRPALKLLSIDSIPTNGKLPIRAEDGILEVEYGYYPQERETQSMQGIITREYKRKKLIKTGNGYTIYRRKIKDQEKVFSEEFDFNEKNGNIYIKPKRYEEYEWHGEKYIRVNKSWIKVQPIKWLVDEKAKIMVTEKTICGGVPYISNIYSPTTNFDKTFIKKFMDEIWSKEILQVLKQQQLETKSSDDFEGR